MNQEIELFVKLKYQIITDDEKTWHLCDAYPIEVRKSWAWRCAADVEHLAKGHPEAEHFIEIAKKYRDGLATKEELDKAWRKVPYAYAAYYRAAYYCATYAYAYYATWPAWTAVRAHNDPNKWSEYIEWLIEELYNYECNHTPID